MDRNETYSLQLFTCNGCSLCKVCLSAARSHKAGAARPVSDSLMPKSIVNSFVYVKLSLIEIQNHFEYGKLKKNNKIAYSSFYIPKLNLKTRYLYSRNAFKCLNIIQSLSNTIKIIDCEGLKMLSKFQACCHC